jgi:predicted nucleic acid-binding protein
VFLLDTNVVSNLRKPRPHPDLVHWLENVPSDELAISVQTVFEMRIGVELVRESDPAKADQIQEWLEDFLKTGAWQILPVVAQTAMISGQMWATPALQNFVIQDPRSKKQKTGSDLIIAAAAIVADATLITFNKDDFLEIHALFPLPGLVNAAGMEWLAGKAPSIRTPG